MRRSYKKKIISCGIIVAILIIIFGPDIYGQRSYQFIEKDNILYNLHIEVVENFTSSAFSECDYRDIIRDETVLSPALVDEDLNEGHSIKEGGEFIPLDCIPKFSTAIIVPYRQVVRKCFILLVHTRNRDRPEQLRGFLVYMHMFFRRQHIHYRIYVVEQVDSRPFNRAKLMNIGAVAAMKAGFPCLVLHDVDLLPLMPANLYACTKHPRHMSSIINKFRFVLPYLSLVGGAISILSKQFKTINGMSNEYYGWGGEDDDLYSRLAAHNLKPCRFQPEISQYHMLKHSPEQKGEKNNQLLNSAKKRMEVDGLNSLHYVEVATVLHPLFTHIMVDL